MAKRGIIGILLAAAVVLVVVLFIFDSHLLSERCDHQVHVLTAEKQRASKHIKELQQALAKSSEMLEKIRVGKAGASASSLHSQLNALTAGGGVKPRRRARQSPPPSPNPPPPSPARAAEQISAAAPAQAAAGFSLLTPGRIAVVVIAYNRPSYLDRALKSIYLHHPGGNSFPVFVSQDGENADVAAVVTRHGARRIVHPRKAVKLKTGTYLAKFPGYAYLSLHYGWALGTLFADADAYEGVIILEEDIEVAPDFFNYFTATAPLLYQDESLLCVSAFNDNGQEKYASDPEAIHRSDFFPGLGWLLTRRLWGELKDKWPNERGFWDDWLREPPQRRGRASIRPEVRRTYALGAARASPCHAPAPAPDSDPGSAPGPDPARSAPLAR
jgi:hypothetical protein